MIEQELKDKHSEFVSLLKEKGMGYKCRIIKEGEPVSLKLPYFRLLTHEIQYSFWYIGTDYLKDGCLNTVNVINYSNEDEANYHLLEKCIEQLKSL